MRGELTTIRLEGSTLLYRDVHDGPGSGHCYVRVRLHGPLPEALVANGRVYLHREINTDQVPTYCFVASDSVAFAELFDTRHAAEQRG